MPRAPAPAAGGANPETRGIRSEHYHRQELDNPGSRDQETKTLSLSPLKKLLELEVTMQGELLVGGCITVSLEQLEKMLIMYIFYNK